MILRLECGPGDFVAEGAPLLFARPRRWTTRLRALRRVFCHRRFPHSRAGRGFGIRQIVDIAMKALSPGVNDTSTAVSCLDYLSAILARLAGRRIVTPFRDEDGKLRVIAPVATFADFVAKSFNEIRLCAAGNVTIVLQILRAIRRVVGAAHHAAPRAAAARTRAARRRTRRSHRAHRLRPARINAELALVRETLEAREELPAISSEPATGPK